jgi:hypothetical protein
MSRMEISTAFSHAGTAIRYSFYFIGAIVLAIIGTVAWSMGSLLDYRVKTVDDGPGFHLAAAHLQRLTASSHILTGRHYGRMEVRQYGQLYDRDVDLTVALIMPPKDTPMIREFGRQLRDIRPMGTARAAFGSTYFDIETRFGPIRATDLRVESDGQWKQCLAYLSRFDTRAVYLAGWYCDPSGAKPSAGQLACTLDKLTLDKDLASREADAFLRARLTRPGSCSAVPVSQTTDTRARGRVSAPQRWSTPSAQRSH